VEAAEAEGANHPRTNVDGPEDKTYAAAFGPRERLCVDVGKNPTVRSGDFVAGPFHERIMRPDISGQGVLKRKIWWAPKQMPELVPYLGLDSVHFWEALRQLPFPPVLHLRATRIGSPAVVTAFRFERITRPIAQSELEAYRNGTGPRPIGGRPFFPTEVRLPSAGNWLVVVTSGDNWGCFIVDEI
jgi:hypothetical protein